MTAQTVMCEAMKWTTTVSNFVEKHTVTLKEALALELRTPSVTSLEGRLQSISQRVREVQKLMLSECREAEEYTPIMQT